MLETINDLENTSSYYKRFFSLSIHCLLYFLWKERNNRRMMGNSSNYSTILFHLKEAIWHKFLGWKHNDDWANLE